MLIGLNSRSTQCFSKRGPQQFSQLSRDRWYLLYKSRQVQACLNGKQIVAPEAYTRYSSNYFANLAVFVAQLIEWSLPIPEIQSSNPVIGNFYILSSVFKNCIENTKIKKKRLGMAHEKTYSAYRNAKLCYQDLFEWFIFDQKHFIFFGKFQPHLFRIFQKRRVHSQATLLVK